MEAEEVVMNGDLVAAQQSLYEAKQRVIEAERRIIEIMGEIGSTVSGVTTRRDCLLSMLNSPLKVSLSKMSEADFASLVFCSFDPIIREKARVFMRGSERRNLRRARSEFGCVVRREPNLSRESLK